MSLVYNGYKRSLQVEVRLDGVFVNIYNGKNGFTSLDGITYYPLTDDQLKVLSNTAYNKRLKDFQDLVVGMNEGLSFVYDVVQDYEAILYSYTCEPVTSTTTTTTSSTTSTTSTTTSTTSSTSSTTTSSTTSTTTTTSSTTSTTSSSTTSTSTTSTTSSSTTTTTTTEYIPPIVEEYGYEYNSYVLPNIAATGWHVPTQVEIDTLLTYVGGASIAGGKLKEVGVTHWITPNTDATNNYGFTSLPASFRSSFDGTWQPYGTQFQIWTQTTIASLGSYNDATAWSSGAFLEKSGISIRLIKDDDVDPGTYVGNNGYVYSTVKIGTQVWISKNLLETQLNDHTPIPQEQNDATWTSLTTGARCYYVI